MDQESTKTEDAKRTIEPGFVVDVWTSNHNEEDDTHGFVGEVQAVDERGMRITLMDWPIGGFVGWDLFVSWKEVRRILVATSAHDTKAFLKEIYSRSEPSSEEPKEEASILF